MLSAVDEDVTVGLLQRKDARHHCLAYRRKLSATAASEPVASENNTGSKHEDLWQKVEQYLGSNQARQYTVSSALRHSQVTSDHETYLQRLCDDFVSDMKSLITQSLVKMQRGSSTKQLVREVLHHRTLAKETLAAESDEEDSGRYSELFQRLQSYIKDPRQSCHPFVIYSPQGSDKSGAVSAVAAAVSSWLPTSELVTILRFIGTTTDSVDVHTCVASVRAQVQMAYDTVVSPACDSLYSELTTFCGVLEQVSRSRAHTEPLFMLLDGVEGLRPHRDALEVLWAVHHLPSNVYLILTVAGSSTTSSGDVDRLEALLALITDDALKYEMRCDSGNDSRQPDNFHQSSSSGVQSSSSAVPHTLVTSVETLMSTLGTMEADYGPMLVKYFTVYTAVMNVGILDSELFDLLATNDDVMSERDHVLFTPGIISILHQRLDDFMASRLVYGRVGFSWSNPEYRQAVAERYQVIVAGNGLETQFHEESTNFTPSIHQQVTQIYHDVTQKSSVLVVNTSLKEDLDNEFDVRTTLQTLGSYNSIKANRMLYHLRVLLPVEGLSRLKSCVFFSLDWLMTRLATSPVFQLINDVVSVYRLCQELHQQAIVTDSFEDIGVLFEFLQLSSQALATNYLSLATEIVTCLGSSTLVKKYQSVDELVSMSRCWLANTGSMALVPLWPVWECPGGIRRHSLDGVSHVVGTVDGGDAVVGYSQRGLSVWSIQTGLMLHNFEVRCEQSVAGVIAAHEGAFVVTSCYSNVSEMTDLTVLSTETGLTVLSAKFHRQFEAVALSEDDEMFVVASLDTSTTDTTNQLSRSVLGIDITSRDVVFQLPFDDVHTQGIITHYLIHIDLPLTTRILY